MTPQHSVSIQDALTDFLASSPTTEQILGYRLPEPLANRLQALMEASSAGNLTPEERDEYENFLRFEHFITMLQLKIRQNHDLSAKDE